MKGRPDITGWRDSMRGSAIASRYGLWGARPTFILAGGMVTSIALSAVFYSLSSLLHPPRPYGEPGAPASVGAWIAAYASWSRTSGELSTGLGASVLAATAFGAAAGVLWRPRAAFVSSFALLNVYFAWSSSALGGVSTTLLNDVTRTIYVQDGYVLGLLDLRGVTGNTYVVADLESLMFLFIVAASTFAMNRNEGYPQAVVYAVRAVAGCLVILGAEIALFDYKEFYTHATQTQVVFGWATWISNADLLLAGALAFAMSWYALHYNGRRPS